MAIKGKKKSQNRGSQARRRPAASPRPQVTAKRKQSWFRSTTGIAVLGILALIAITVTVLMVQKAGEKADELEARQTQLDDYANQVRSVLQSLRPPAGAMASVPPGIEDEEGAAQLEEDAAGWVEQIEKGQTSFGEVAPPPRLIELEPSVQNIHNLYAQSISIYLSAARTYQLAAASDDKTQADTLASATAQRSQASAVWTEATALLDKRRASADIDPSGLSAPDGVAGAPPGAPPGELPTDIPTEIPTDQLPPEGGEGGAPPEGGGGQDGGGQDGGNANDG